MRSVALVLAACAIAFPALAQDGETLYQKHCSYCHGARGEGGRGPDLTTGRFRRAQNDEELFAVIRNGVRGTEMPAVRGSDDEVRRIVAHVRSLAVRTDAKAIGDPQAGAVVFKQCSGCHPGIGPDLRAAAFRGAAFARESILKPEAEIANGYRALQVTLSDGRKATGIRLNEDDISLQIRDTDGALRSFLKSGISAIDRSKPSLMPSFERRLSPKQLDDVVAYVTGLQ
ncbi:MAG: c-type cytochrome [Bryobacteraceae bacterium]